MISEPVNDIDTNTKNTSKSNPISNIDNTTSFTTIPIFSVGKKVLPINNKPIKNLNKIKPYEFWDYIGKPKHVCAPMVDQSELAFRLLTRRYGVDLAYTPMFHSVVFTNCEKSRKNWMNDIKPSLESPTFVQFCGHDPEILLKAAKLVEGKCEGIDLNLGCPQGIARRGNYGSYLLDNTELVLKIIGYLSNNIVDSAVTCKIRVFPDLNKTYSLVQDLEKAGAKVIAVHGRTKEEKGQFVKECNYEAISKIKELVNVPLIANGGVENYQEVVNCFEKTKCDAVMSSEALLEYPALFKGGDILNIDDLALEYLEISKELGNDTAFVRSHMFKFMYQACQEDPSLNPILGNKRGYDEFIDFTKKVKESRKSTPNENKLGWYRRYREDKESNIDGRKKEEGERKEKISLVNRKKQKVVGKGENTLMNLDEDMMGDMMNMFEI
mmetsp:Transcript_15976/g.16573  ORF Transcript_15976/g.16573 Transcript_15976/m.16573 type:complete len:439 (+) Transcript_15976:17-1333(+)